MNCLTGFLSGLGTEDYLVLIFLAGNSVRDIKRCEISLPLTLAGAAAGGVAAVLIRRDLPIGLFISAVPGVVSLMLTLLTGGSVGAGDGLILLMLGLYYPAGDLIVILSVALFLSAVVGAALLIRHHRGSEKFAFVPFLMFGVIALKILESGG